VFGLTVDSFVIQPVDKVARCRQQSLSLPVEALNLSSSSSPPQGATINIFAKSGCDEEAIVEAANFLVDSFWLGSPRQWVDEAAGNAADVSDSVKTSLVVEQAADLMLNYGERMGKQMLNSCLVFASHDGGSLLGLAGMQVLLLDSNRGNILKAEQSEEVVKNAVASLGPKQRRLYKDATVQQIAEELLPPTQEAICFFCNLAVSPDARRQGIALQLCQELERIAKSWNFDNIYLKVENDNEAAMRLYKDKLGYECVLTVDGDPAVRLDTKAGEFIETPVKTMLLKKAL